VLEVVDLLVPDSMFVFSASPAAIFRSLGDRQITLLFDEVDTIWSNRAKQEGNEDLRALLNAGYKQGATIPRCVGKSFEVQYFPVFAAVVLAGLGGLPDTIMSRSIIINMRRRGPNERIEPFRRRVYERDGYALRDRLAGWASRDGEKVGEAWPEMPPGVEDRNAEVWEPLIAVADAAGGEWPTRAREACVHLIAAAQDRRVSLGVRLLQDLRTVFADRPAMHTMDLLTALKAGDDLDDDAPWADLYGVGLTDRKLASLLRPYGITSTKVRIGPKNLNGYTQESLWDAWQRYTPQKAEQAEQAEQSSNGEASSVPEGVPDGAEHRNTTGTPRANEINDVPDVPDVPDFQGCDGRGSCGEIEV
jgi:hypothetical protein